MEDIRYYRIADINSYDLDYANQSLLWAKEKLAELKDVKYDGEIPKELYLNVHLTIDEIYFLEKRIGYLLDKQLDEYYSETPSYSWNKKEACKNLREASENESIVIPLAKLFSLLSDALYYIPDSNTRVSILRNLAVVLKSQDYVSEQRCNQLMNDCMLY